MNLLKRFFPGLFRSKSAHIIEQSPEPGNDQLQVAIERLYENERLTDALADQAAKSLLGWGEQQLKWLTGSRPEPGNIDQVTNQVQLVMRTVNRLAGQRAELSEDNLTSRLLELVQQAAQLSPDKLVNDQAQQLAPAVQRLASQRVELSETDFVARLLELVEQAIPLSPHHPMTEQEKTDDKETTECSPQDL